MLMEIFVAEIKRGENGRFTIVDKAISYEKPGVVFYNENGAELPAFNTALEILKVFNFYANSGLFDNCFREFYGNAGYFLKPGGDEGYIYQVDWYHDTYEGVHDLEYFSHCILDRLFH